jgi:hypothetical protein
MTLAAGVPVGLAVARSVELLGRDYSSVFSPVAVPVVLPFMFGVPALVVVLLWVVVFVTWHRSLLVGSSMTPSRSLWMWAVCAVLSLANFAAGWHYGLKYQGRTRMLIWLVASLLLCATSGMLLWTSRKHPGFARALAAHTLLWLWITTVAFPWLGEMM